MIKKMYLLSVVFAALSGPALCQQSQGKELPVEQKKLDLLKGTYQVVNNSREMPMLPSNLADIIEQNRKESELNTIKLNDNVTLIIYPKNGIVNSTPADKK